MHLCIYISKEKTGEQEKDAIIRQKENNDAHRLLVCYKRSEYIFLLTCTSNTLRGEK